MHDFHLFVHLISTDVDFLIKSDNLFIIPFTEMNNSVQMFCVQQNKNNIIFVV